MEKGVKPFEFKECVIVPRSTGNPGRQFIVFSQNHDQVGNSLARPGIVQPSRCASTTFTGRS